jgi:hypothetical protein
MDSHLLVNWHHRTHVAHLFYSINLPPSFCMKYEFMFLYLIIPGSDHSGKKLNVMLQPLIEELKELWKGVKAYDVFKSQKFNL